MHTILDTWLAEASRKKIFLLRHGAIETRDDGKRFIGQTDLPLNDRGRAQARYWRDCLAAISPAHIVASDLSRCAETARIVSAGRGKVETDAGLREIRLGQWDGVPFDQVKRRWPEAYRQRGMDLAGFRPPGGESFLDLQRRVVPVFEAAVGKPGRTILLVAHAGVIRVILCHVLGLGLENLFRLAQGLAAMNLIDRRTTGYQVHLLNLPPA
jgi:broad specificity phosphatase PhoE